MKIFVGYMLGIVTGIAFGILSQGRPYSIDKRYPIEPTITYENPGYVTLHCPANWTLQAEDWKCHNVPFGW
jgi:hypothetical protein